jgi:hypothetical protein
MHDRPQPERVVGRDEVERPTHERHPDGRSIADEVAEIPGPEAVEPRPQARIRRGRDLGLHADEVLERRRDGHIRRRCATKEHLAGEERAIQRPEAKDLARLRLAGQPDLLPGSRVAGESKRPARRAGLP